METKKRPIGTVVLVILALILGMAGGVVLDHQVGYSLAFGPATPTSSTSLNDNLINQAWNLIQQQYVDRSSVNAQTQTYGAISGMVDSLGDTGHSRFLSPQMVKEESNFTQGSFEGIGAEVEMKNGNVVIVTPLDNSPAQKAGLQPGDIIQKVNGQDVTGETLNQVVSKILGPAGTKVTLTILHEGSTTPIQVTITRAKITVNNVTWQMLPGTHIADVRIAAFSQGVDQDLIKALNDAKSQGATGIILDLRNNPGGLLDQAISVSSQFIGSGVVMEEKNANGQITKLNANPGGAATNIPMVVLINEGTASASEIVSGAIQDHNRAKLVGQTTFGTGTVLNEFSLSDGSALLLATEEWLTPNGRVIWHHGIVPDVSVALPNGVIPLSPEAMRNMTAQQLQASQDTQLLAAMKLLQP